MVFDNLPGRLWWRVLPVTAQNPVQRKCNGVQWRGRLLWADEEDFLESPGADDVADALVAGRVNAWVD